MIRKQELYLVLVNVTALRGVVGLKKLEIRPIVFPALSFNSFHNPQLILVTIYYLGLGDVSAHSNLPVERKKSTASGQFI